MATQEVFPTRRLNVTLPEDIYLALKAVVADKHRTTDGEIVEEALREHPKVKAKLNGRGKR